MPFDDEMESLMQKKTSKKETNKKSSTQESQKTVVAKAVAPIKPAELKSIVVEKTDFTTGPSISV